MGKQSKYPSYSGGTVNINGQNKASTYKQGNSIVTNYNMSEDEKRAYDYAQKSFADSLASVNVFDDNTKANLQSQLDAYTQKGKKIIDNLYTPMINDLKTDIASRFGNFDNSVFLDKLNSIESNRADSMNSLAQDVLAKSDEFVNNELSQRYNYLNFLQDIQNQVNSNILNFANVTQANSSSGNTYNAQAYASNNAISNSILGSYANLASGLLGNIGGYGTAASTGAQIANYL